MVTKCLTEELEERKVPYAKVKHYGNENTWKMRTV